MLTFLDLFAGIGGFRLGMERAGHKCVGYCEYDKFANLSYKAMHNPKEDEWFEKDIREIRAENIPKADVWCFGFPCQDISIAGNKLGFKGNRSSLFFSVTKLIRELKEEDRPKYLLIENVKNLLSVNRGFDFAKLLIELDEIGYNAEWQNLNSKNFRVPQNRDRIYIVGHLRRRSTREVFPITGTSRKTTLEQLNNPNHSSNRIYDSNGLSKCLLSKGGNNTGLYRVGNINPSGNGAGGQVYSSEGFSTTLTTGKGESPKILIKENTKKGYVKASIGDGIRLDHIEGKTGRGRVQHKKSCTLTTASNAGVIGKKFRVRRLTPKECFRLQGFPDDYYDRAASVCSETQLYKQAGNSVTVDVVEEIAKKLK